MPLHNLAQPSQLSQSWHKEFGRIAEVSPSLWVKTFSKALVVETCTLCIRVDSGTLQGSVFLRSNKPARLHLLALYRALEGMDLSVEEIPQGPLRQLLERDADYAEALWELDQVGEVSIAVPCSRIPSPHWTSCRQNAPVSGPPHLGTTGT
jgi:hypothetical protein